MRPGIPWLYSGALGAEEILLLRLAVASCCFYEPRNDEMFCFWGGLGKVAGQGTNGCTKATDTGACGTCETCVLAWQLGWHLDSLTYAGARLHSLAFGHRHAEAHQ